MRLDILLPILLAFGALAWIYRRDRRRFEAERAMLLDDAAGLLEAAVASREAMGYPRLRGRYKGYEASIDAVLDNLSVRKIPSLWLRVTVRADLPFAGSCDMLARAHNVEFYSPSIDFDHVLPLPAGWPEQLTIKSDDPEHMPLPEQLAKHVDVFRDPLVKELLVTPRGVRLVRQAAQASRAEYLVLRQAKFGPVVVPRDLLAGLLDRAVALAEDLRRPAATPLLETGTGR